jgi:murein L,D-transpeptidase YcbB/YkuD
VNGLRRYLATIGLGLSLCGAPAASQNWQGSPQSQPAVGAAYALPVSGAVSRYYQERGNPLIWFQHGRSSPAASQLLQILHRAPIDGFGQGPQIAIRLQSVVREAQSGHPAALLRADQQFSNAWVAYVQAIRARVPGIHYGDDAAVPDTSAFAILQDSFAAPVLPRHLRTVSDINPTYARLRQAILSGRQTADPVVYRRLMLNLARARALPTTGKYVLVDIPNATLFMVEDGAVHGTMKVAVGKREAQTPVIASVINYATFNPYWNVPGEMVRDRIAPNVLQQGTEYLTSRGYDVLADWSENARVIPASRIDWQAVAEGRLQVRVRQRPGPANSMGDLKFAFENDLGIFLHDTPQKQSFDGVGRTVSAGCVRLEDAERLARWLFAGTAMPRPSGAETHVRLPKGVPVFTAYLTARFVGDQVVFADDIYGLDDTRRLASR